MTNKKVTRRALLMSVTSLLICISMLLGTTFAWFTDEVTSGVNKIVAGNLDVELYHTNPATAANATDDDKKVGSNTKLFQTAIGTDVLWEPEAMTYETFEVRNVGTLALKYQLMLNEVLYNIVTWAADNTAGVAAGEHNLTEVIQIGVIDGATAPTRDDIRAAATQTIKQAMDSNWVAKTSALEAGASQSFTVVLYWPQSTADNNWNLKNTGWSLTQPTESWSHANELAVEFGIKLLATQQTSESDSFNNLYDETADTANADFANAPAVAVTINDNTAATLSGATVATDNKTVTASTGTVIASAAATSTIPAATTFVMSDTNNGDVTVTLTENDSVTNLSRTIKTTESSAGSATYDISFKATVTTTENNQVTGTQEYAVHTFSNIVSNEIYIGKGLANVLVKHGTEYMTNSTLHEDGTYYYNAETGMLYIYSKSYSAYAVSWTLPDVEIVAANATSGTRMTLGEFRDSVNTGTDYAGYTVKLLQNVDLGGAEWTPIGTSTNPFSGVFDGQGYKISNLKVNSTSGYAGLFGYIKGDMSNCPEKASLPEGWDESSIAINEANYKAGVKELNIDGFEVKSSGGKKFCGTIVGYAEYALLRDLTVSNGLVNNTDKSYAGGIVGGTSAGMAFENLTVSETVEVKAGDHSVGGIVGGTNNDASNKNDITNKEFLVIFSNCTNKANVSTTSSSGYAGGIVGHTNGGKTAIVVKNCNNRGEIKCQTLTGGIVGESDKVDMLFSCINYGKVWNDATSGDNFLGGITGKKASGSLRIIACINNGEVTGYANNGKIAGIIGSATGTTIEGCVNNGTITNTKENGTYDDITAGAANILVANEETYTVNSSVSGEMTSVTIIGGETTCTSIVIENENIKKVFVSIDNFNGTITGLAGKTLYISGANNTVTIPQDTYIGKVVVSGANCTIINNGTVATIRFEVAGNHSIVNSGNITNTTDFAFTISSTVNGANVAITNNGTIAASEQEGAYALYFGSGAKCTVNNHGTITGSNFGKVTVS